jgi:hypothetical protein
MTEQQIFTQLAAQIGKAKSTMKRCVNYTSAQFHFAAFCLIGTAMKTTCDEKEGLYLLLCARSL